MTKSELESALIAAGWNKQTNYDQPFLTRYNKNNKQIILYETYFLFMYNAELSISIFYTDCRLIEVPMKDGTTYRAIVCDIDGLFLRIEL